LKNVPNRMSKNPGRKINYISNKYMKLFCALLVCLFSLQIFANGTNSGIVLHPTAITLTITKVNTTCQKKNGRIVVKATGGIAPYDYRVSGPFSPQPSGIFFSLPAGSYTITVTDAVGEVATQGVTLTNTFLSPNANAVSVVKPSGCNSFDGGFTIVGSGGAPPYTYSLDNINFQASNIYTNLTAGSYQYSVKDANGCSSFPIIFGINVGTGVTSVGGNCTIKIGSTGAGVQCAPIYSVGITFNSVSGGTPPYSFSSDGINYQTSNRFVGIAPVSTFWIKDATGLICLYSNSNMDECYQPFSVEAIVQTAQCGLNGSITIMASNGVPPYNYSIDGVNFQPGNQFTGLTPGSYTITVKDGDNLENAKLVTVPNNCVAVTTTTTSSTCGNSNGKITAQGINGTAPYQYSIDGAIYSNNNIFTNLAATNYTVYTKDATGTVGKATVVVSNIAGPQITAVDTTATGCTNNTGIINVTATNGTAPLLYSIDGTNFKNSRVFTDLAKGNYTVTVKDKNDCSITATAIINIINNAPTVNFGNDVTLCEDQTLLLDASNTNATYQWQDNTSMPTYLVSKQGNYFVAVTKAGCTARDTVNIAYNLKPKFSLGADSRLCIGSTLILDPKITGAVVNYLWQDGSTAPTYTVTQPGLYSVTATNTCGSTTDAITIGDGVCSLYVPNSFTPNGDTKNDLFKPGYGDNVIEYRLQVFNRYGQIVFTTTDKNKGWDGTSKGTAQPYGSYVWVIRYKTAVNNNWQNLRGAVLLIR
jgi:large repetitive protein